MRNFVYATERASAPVMVENNARSAGLAILFVAAAQFVDQMVKIGRRLQHVRAQAPLQPLADGIAYRSAGLPIDIDIHVAVAAPAIHDLLRLVVILSSRGIKS
jgi:hypothetical protein